MCCKCYIFLYSSISLNLFCSLFTIEEGRQWNTVPVPLLTGGLLYSSLKVKQNLSMGANGPQWHVCGCESVCVHNGEKRNNRERWEGDYVGYNLWKPGNRSWSTNHNAMTCLLKPVIFLTTSLFNTACGKLQLTPYMHLYGCVTYAAPLWGGIHIGC